MQEEIESNWLQEYSAIIEASIAKSTRRAYARDVIYFWAWGAARSAARCALSSE